MHPFPHSFRRPVHVFLSFAAALFVLTAFTGIDQANAEDWPTYAHDNSRSNVTKETVGFPLQQQWVYKSPAPPAQGWGDPHDYPVEGVSELPKVKFDDVYHVVAADGAMYFGCSVENAVCSLDAATGTERWRFFTGGPVRLAPTLHEGRVYFGSDDGFAYCLNAADGSLVWKAPGGPSDRRVLGHGRMISMWPQRTSVLIDGDTAYFGAGIFPGERVFMHAVNKVDGSPIWQNDTVSDQGAGTDQLSPQGYLLASDTRLWVPSGRSLPACFSKEDGKFVYQRNYGRWQVGPTTGTFASLGGSYALLSGEHLYVGAEFVAGYDATSGNLGFAWFPGQKLVVTADTSYMLEKSGLTALDRIKYPEFSRQRRAVAAQIYSISGGGGTAEEKNAKLKPLREEYDKITEQIEGCTRWAYEGEGLENLIITADAIIIGGEDVVIGLDRTTGAQKWSAPVDGKAKGLALANGRLYVSTTSGSIYVFAAGKSPANTAAPRQNVDNPYPDDETTALCRAAAKQILQETGITRGYCLVLGSGDGRLAYELAKNSDLQVYGICPKADKTAEGMRILSKAGIYGSRVTLENGDLKSLPYSDYFANLVVSGQALMTGKLDTPPEEVMRVLKPCGGVAIIGQPQGAAPALDAGALRDWFAGLEGSQVKTTAGLWGKVTRGPLPGAGEWTHQYGDPGNTASSADTALECPLEVLWYGEPGPDKVPSRHAGNQAPLSINGKVFLEGLDEIMCFDAYNGLMYWDRKIEGAQRTGMIRECGNMACDDESLFIAAKDQCLRLDQDTGETTNTYEMPKIDDQRRSWRYVSVADGVLVGSSSTGSQISDAVFAIDLKTGANLWTYKGKSIRNNAIAISDGRVFLPDMEITAEQRIQALKPRIDELVASKKMTQGEAEAQLKDVDVRMVVALDIRTGKNIWAVPVDLTGCEAHVLTGMAHDGVLVFCASHNNGHYWPQFLGGEYASRGAVALSMEDGSLMWSKALGYRIRPLIVEDTLVAEPWGFDLKTGEQKMRTNPITGLPSKWQFERPGHHCGTISGSPNGLWFRSASFGYYDTQRDQGTEHFAGQRPGCWINMIPANGLLVAPEASSGCVCLFSIHATTVLKPSKVHKAWGIFSDPGATMPVKQLRLNLGAQGDRAAANGDLWFSMPRPRTTNRMKVNIDAQLEVLPGCGDYSNAGELSAVQGTDDPWLYSSGYTGLTKLSAPLVGEADGPAIYTVRLHFAETDNAAPGQRVFDIKLQGKQVASGLDIVKAAGGPNKAIVREFTGIRVDDNLTLELLPEAEKPDASSGPILQGIEIVREYVLQVGMKVPGFTVSDLDTKASADIKLANYTDRVFSGRLEINAPDMFAVAPARRTVELKPGDTLSVPLTVGVAKKGQKADYDIACRLISADGKLETEQQAHLEYLGARGRKTIVASEDTYVSNGAPTTNYGHGATMAVDGGNAAMGDESHNIGYLKFPIDVPGKPVSVKFRIYVPAGGHTQSGDSGRIKLVEGDWGEYTINYSNRPKTGKELATLGKVDQTEWVERDLDIDLTGMKDLSVVLDPTGCDGATYVTREGKEKPEIVIEYEAAQ